MRLGIDFGTTHTVVAYCDRGNYPLVSFVDTQGDAFDWLPSLAAHRGGELRFGFAAEAIESEPAATPFRSIKRLLRNPHAEPIAVGEAAFTPPELVARFLHELKTALRVRSKRSR